MSATGPIPPTTQLIERFQDYVKDVYDVDITLNYIGSQTPSTYLTDLYTAVGAGDDSPYDVLAIEENYWAEVAAAQATPAGTKLMEDFLPSGLMPNADRVLDNAESCADLSVSRPRPRRASTTTATMSTS